MKLSPEQLEKLLPERRALLQRRVAERTGARRAAPDAPDVPRRRGDGPAPLSCAQRRLEERLESWKRRLAGMAAHPDAAAAAYPERRPMQDEELTGEVGGTSPDRAEG